jgi:hypothetical protein
MDEDEYITVHSPRLARGFYDGYVTVGEEQLYGAIDALRVRVAEWDAFVGDERADEASRARLADAAQALADLLAAIAAHEREGGIRELVRHIAAFMSDSDARAYLDALREELQRDKKVRESQRPHLSPTSAARSDRRVWEIVEELDILDALIALHETLQRREAERIQEHERRHNDPTQQLPAAEQGPAEDPDPGWEF